MTSSPGAHGEVELVLSVWQQLIHVPPVGSQPLWRYMEMGSSAVTQNDKSPLFGSRTKYFLVGPGLVAPIYTVAIVVNAGIVAASHATGVYITQLVVAIITAPVRSTEPLSLRNCKTVTIMVLQRQVAIHKCNDVAGNVISTISVIFRVAETRESGCNNTNSWNTICLNILDHVSKYWLQNGKVSTIKASLDRPLNGFRGKGINWPR
mmetsp:Transcript_16826/g.25300  ORF Transcript_16826/g.25300 Transcript_16826/m.25300 type:complete len:207 (-) Transcript_16826:319-939(-)